MSEETQENNKSISICDHMSNHLCDAGRFFNVEAAANSLQAYFQKPGTPLPTDPNHIYGHTFGLNQIRKMLYEIDLYNASQRPGEMLIKGIRVYHGESKRQDPHFPLPDRTYPDLFFMPVKEDGVDLYTVHSIVGNESILGESRPCPNECGPQMYFY